jgi:hypothetical protein
LPNNLALEAVLSYVLICLSPFQVVPGGGIEQNEKPDAAAQREAYEEAGVLGIVCRLLGIFEVVSSCACII